MGNYDKHAAIVCGHTPAGLICLWFSTRSGYSMYKHAGLALFGFCDGLEPPENCILRTVGVFAWRWVFSFVHSEEVIFCVSRLLRANLVEALRLGGYVVTLCTPTVKKINTVTIIRTQRTLKP